MTKAPTVIVPKLHEVRIRAEGPNVVLIVDGRTVLHAPWQRMRDLGNALLTKARVAQKVDNQMRSVKPKTIFGIPVS